MQPQLLREIGETLAVLVQDRRLALLAVVAQSSISQKHLRGERWPNEPRTSGWRRGGSSWPLLRLLVQRVGCDLAAASSLPLGSYNVSLFCRHLRQTVSRSRDTLGFHREGGTGF